jgi:hypothetical protein
VNKQAVDSTALQFVACGCIVDKDGNSNGLHLQYFVLAAPDLESLGFEDLCLQTILFWFQREGAGLYAIVAMLEDNVRYLTCTDCHYGNCAIK